MLLDLLPLLVLQRDDGEAPSLRVARAARRPTLFEAPPPPRRHGESHVRLVVDVDGEPTSATGDGPRAVLVDLVATVAPLPATRGATASSLRAALATTGRRRHTAASLRPLRAEDELLLLAVASR